MRNHAKQNPLECRQRKGVFQTQHGGYIEKAEIQTCIEIKKKNKKKNNKKKKKIIFF